jgi:hypothetical protein
VKFLMVILFAVGAIFGQAQQAKAVAPVPQPIQAPMDTSAFKARMEIEALRNEVKNMAIQNVNTREDAKDAVNHVDYFLIGMFAFFALFAYFTRSTSNREAENLKHGLQLDQKEKLDALQKALEAKNASLEAKLEADFKALEQRLLATLTDEFTKTFKTLGEVVQDRVHDISMKVRDMSLAHQLFRMNVYLKLERPQQFCDALNAYYLDAMGLGDYGEIAKAYDDMVEPIRLFLFEYADKGPSVKKQHLAQLKTIIEAIGAHSETDVSKPLATLSKMKGLIVLPGSAGNPWERWLRDDLGVIPEEDPPNE